MIMAMKANTVSIVITACFTVILLSTNILANTQVCTEKEAIAAEMAPIAQSWEQLHQQFKQYSHCDDGAISEGFSESVTLLLAEHWQELWQLEKILKHDSTFLKFVVRHINETVPVERLNRIVNNAHKQCPKSLKSLCRDIEVVAQKSAQAEM